MAILFQYGVVSMAQMPIYSLVNCAFQNRYALSWNKISNFKRYLLGDHFCSAARVVLKLVK